MRPGTLFIDMASIQPEARDHAARLGEMGLAHLDAPVSGGTVAERHPRHHGRGRAEDFRSRATGVRRTGSRYTMWAARQRAARQTGQPDDCGHHHRCRGRSLLFAAKGGADMAKSARGHPRRVCRQPHPAIARPAHGGPRLCAKGTHGRSTQDMRNALGTAKEIGLTHRSRACLKPCTPKAWNTAWANWTTAGCLWSWPVATQCNKFLHDLRTTQNRA